MRRGKWTKEEEEAYQQQLNMAVQMTLALKEIKPSLGWSPMVHHIARDPQLQGNQFKLLSVLLSYVFVPQVYCDIPISQLMRDMAMSERQVLRVIKELVTDGWIAITRQGKRNRYWMRLDWTGGDGKPITMIAQQRAQQRNLERRS